MAAAIATIVVLATSGGGEPGSNAEASDGPAQAAATTTIPTTAIESSPPLDSAVNSAAPLASYPPDPSPPRAGAPSFGPLAVVTPGATAEIKASRDDLGLLVVGRIDDTADDNRGAHVQVWMEGIDLPWEESTDGGASSRTIEFLDDPDLRIMDICVFTQNRISGERDKKCLDRDSINQINVAIGSS